MNHNINFLIAIKSSNIENLISSYNFTIATLNNSNISIKMIFFYQNGANILLNTDINNKWATLINNYNLSALICSASYKKRGINIKEPFKSGSMIEFISICDIVDRVIQF